jgi:hypothetical protein
LNSRNENVQNSISRITEEEDKYGRKKRLLEEEEEERKDEQDVMRFKEMKRPSKRKQDQAPRGW